MLYALLYDGQDRLLAAAPAVLQHATGDAFWRDSYTRRLPLDADCQTAHVEIEDPQLREMLDTLQTDDQFLQVCETRVEAIIHSGDGPGSGGSRRHRAA